MTVRAIVGAVVLGWGLGVLPIVAGTAAAEPDPRCSQTVLQYPGLTGCGWADARCSEPMAYPNFPGCQDPPVDVTPPNEGPFGVSALDCQLAIHPPEWCGAIDNWQDRRGNHPEPPPTAP